MAQTTAPKTKTENKPTIAILDGFANAFNAHDVARILSYMTDDCVFQASAGPDADGERFAGKDAVKKAFEDVDNQLQSNKVGLDDYLLFLMV